MESTPTYLSLPIKTTSSNIPHPQKVKDPNRLSRKEFRKLKKRRRRKRIRKELYSTLESEHNEPDEPLNEKDDEEKERQRLLWELRERQFEKLNKERRQQEEIQVAKRELVRKSWQAAVQREKQNLEFDIQDASNKNSLEHKSLITSPNQITIINSSQQPEQSLQSLCPNFKKFGLCRNRLNCHHSHSLTHEQTQKSRTLLIHHLFDDWGLQIPKCAQEDSDDNLENEDEDEVETKFAEWYQDVYPEFLKFGKILHFKVIRNRHLTYRGNTYVEYATNEEATEAMSVMNTRWFSLKKVKCELVSDLDWGTIVCGNYDLGRCYYGHSCIYLHLFSNPSLKILEHNPSRIN